MFNLIFRGQTEFGNFESGYMQCGRVQYAALGNLGIYAICGASTDGAKGVGVLEGLEDVEAAKGAKGVEGVDGVVNGLDVAFPPN